MTVSSISSNAATFARSIDNSNTKRADALASIALGSRFTSPSVDVSGLAIASALQSEAAGLTATSQNLAQSSALVDTAAAGADQIQQGLARLSQLATQASSSTLSSDDRTVLNNEFQTTLNEINSIATTTNFNGQNLLDGSLAGSGATASGAGSPALNISSLTTASLFGGTSPDLLSASNAQAALTAIGTAQSAVSNVQSEIASIGESLEFSAANVNSALQNQLAAASTLSDTDIGAASTQAASSAVQSQFSVAAAVQTNRLKANVLDLLKE